MKAKDYQSIIDSIIKQCGFNVKTSLMKKNELIGYDVEANTICFNYKMLHNYLMLNFHKTLNANLTDKKMIEILVCHELGHYLDFKNNIINVLQAKLFKVEGTEKDYLQFVYEREYDAWKNGRKLVSKDIIDEYDSFNENNLKIVKEKMELIQ